MISNEALEQRLRDTSEVEFVKVEGDGYHYNLTIVSEAFVGKSLVARQQWVYAQLKELITSGTLHALSMKTWTKEEWEKKHG
ncbi:BolA like protein [Legionella quinlivanii]|uniref:BolA like protein n=1 Tax=Legionella quinlivanii TaxID=45073 RepID=A0A0W0XKY6_9GAMM|nr:BolA/IbaG family iron-sulfur metabolism protein [Legionella quinlivanii]KTD45309.1 BolA like protein [Legionella quinlivanii]MCW8450430.1 BolA/IbaG family iron-sulfur metabolism protein [Legionella quinlivanii]SEG02125.1 Acid stress-induced BolA-like protein IbaG/YrbA, predicted regulator of iron metabolism [Legionella quinlivanii DSM 21216]STY11391.1 BolA like protein [Legionella quinlivanii]